MNRFALLLLFAAPAATVCAQTSAKSPTTQPAVNKTSSATVKAAAAPPWIKLPPGVPAVAHGPVRTIPISVHYEDIKVGTGAAGESGKLWHLVYTGWRAADGVKFDSSYDHRMPIIGKDGKPEIGPDGSPKLGEAPPMAIPQGIGAVIPGFDYGLAGMRIGGKRRIFIPWQLAYGTRDLPARPSRIPGMPGFPGIPPKSDLIFDVELVEVSEIPPPHPTVPPMQPRPSVPPHSGGNQQPGAAPATAPAQPATAAPATKPAPAATSTPSQTPASAAPTQSQPK